MTRVEQLPQQIVNGLWQGGALALFALGYTLVFGSLDIVNLAHGALYMWGAYIGLLVVTRLDLPFWAAIPAAMVAAGLMAVLLDLLAFKPLRALTYGLLVLWAGFIVLLIGLTKRGPKDVLNIGYSYDYTVSKLGSSSGGAHEFSISYSWSTRDPRKPPKDKLIIPCPKF